MMNNHKIPTHILRQIRELDEEERQRAKEREKANRKEE